MVVSIGLVSRGETCQPAQQEQHQNYTNASKHHTSATVSTGHSVQLKPMQNGFLCRDMLLSHSSSKVLSPHESLQLHLWEERNCAKDCQTHAPDMWSLEGQPAINAVLDRIVLPPARETDSETLKQLSLFALRTDSPRAPVNRARPMLTATNSSSTSVCSRVYPPPGTKLNATVHTENRICEQEIKDQRARGQKQGSRFETKPEVKFFKIIFLMVAGHLGAADGLKTSSIHVCVCPHFGM